MIKLSVIIQKGTHWCPLVVGEVSWIFDIGYSILHSKGHIGKVTLIFDIGYSITGVAQSPVGLP